MTPAAAALGPLGLPVAVVLAGLAGVVAGLASLTLYVSDWGLVLSTVTCAGALLLVPAGWVRSAAAAGWCLALLVAARGGPGGDLLVAQDVRALFLLLDGFVFVGVAAASWPRDRASGQLSSAP